jgi:hypothetical protein
LKAEFAHVVRHEVHAAFKIDVERHGDLLEGAWRHVPPMLVAAYALDGYARALLHAGVEHSDDHLTEWLDRRG